MKIGLVSYKFINNDVAFNMSQMEKAMRLVQEKDIGNVRLLDNGKHSASYLSQDNNPAIISKETFQAVQIEKQHRSNVIKGEEGSRRKSKKYSSKP